MKPLTRIVEVTWADPCAFAPGWEDPKKIKKTDYLPQPCRSAGYVFYEDDEFLVLVGSQNSKNGRMIDEIGDGLSIPKVLIKSLVELKG